MNIFIAFGGEDSDEVDTIGVFSTLERAAQAYDSFGFAEEWTLDGEFVGRHDFD